MDVPICPSLGILFGLVLVFSRVNNYFSQLHLMHNNTKICHLCIVYFNKDTFQLNHFIILDLDHL